MKYWLRAILFSVAVSTVLYVADIEFGQSLSIAVAVGCGYFLLECITRNIEN